MSLRKSVINGSVWTLLGFGLSQVLRLGGNIVLAAVLYQEAFALMGARQVRGKVVLVNS